MSPDIKKLIALVAELKPPGFAASDEMLIRHRAELIALVNAAPALLEEIRTWRAVDAYEGSIRDIES